MGKRRALIPYFLHILLHVFIFIGFIAVVPLGSVYFNYTDFARQVLGVKDVVVCPPNCTIDLAPQRHEARVVIVVDNPSGTPVALSVYTTQGQGKVITTDRTTRLEVFFNGGLYVDVYPLYPLSDSEPRKVYLPSGGNLAIRVAPPAIGGVLPTLIALIGTITGIMASLGIIRYVTRTPLVDTIGETSSTHFVTFYTWALIFILLLILTGTLQTLYGLYFIDILENFIALILLVIYAIIVGAIIIAQEPELENKIRNIVLTVTILIILWIIVLSYIFDKFLRFIIFIALVNPVTLTYLKSFAVVEEIERTKKVGVLHLYDLTTTFWFLQWLINPYPTVFRKMLYNFSFQLIVLLMLIMIYLGLFVTLLYLIAKGPGSRTLLFSAIPFVFNEELAARIEFCRKALDKPTRVKVYPEEDKSVMGFVVECNMDKIAIGDGNSTHVFSWSDVQQIEL